MENSLTKLDVKTLIDKNMELGYDETDAIIVTYDDIKEMQRGKETPLYKYSLIEYGTPATVGKYFMSQLKAIEKEKPGFLPLTIKKGASKKRAKLISNISIYTILTIVAGIVFIPLLILFMNSFKEGSAISLEPFVFPTGDKFVGIDNYLDGFKKMNFFMSLGYSLFITVASTLLILLFTSMTAWFLVRVKTIWTQIIYYMILFSQVVPFQLVMLPMNKLASIMNINNLFGIVLIYIAFGAGLSVFMYSGFVKSVPLEIEEAAMIDGCNPIQTFFKIVFPVLKPTTVTIAILNAMWIWNDYLLPSMILGTAAGTGKTTLPVAIQMANTGSYGSVSYGTFMAMITLTLIPIVVFYLFGQKYIIKGVTAGAVKG